MANLTGMFESLSLDEACREPVVGRIDFGLQSQAMRRLFILAGAEVVQGLWNPPGNR